MFAVSNTLVSQLKNFQDNAQLANRMANMVKEKMLNACSLYDMIKTEADKASLIYHLSYYVTTFHNFLFVVNNPNDLAEICEEMLIILPILGTVFECKLEKSNDRALNFLQHFELRNDCFANYGLLIFSYLPLVEDLDDLIQLCKSIL